MSSDLNLLFGFLAVQNGFVREEALVRATNTWTGSKNRTIGEILLEQGAIRRDQLDLLNALVKEKLLQNDNDVSKTLAGLSSVDGARQAVARISDEDVQHTMTQMGASRSVAGPGEDTNRMADAPARPAFNESATGVVDDDFTGTRTAVTSAPDFHGTVTGGSPPEFQGTVTGGTNAGSGTATPQQVFGHQTLPNSAGRKVQPLQEGRRFRIIRPHAKGGLGEVFLAKDQELNREVALKEILPKHSVDQDTRGRFMLEAEITGGLEHPGIVPVYGLGTYDDGRPYYAMRFIQGDSLKEAISAYHDKPNPDEGERNVVFRNLLKRFVDVCNAIGYAHSRGVLHRDLKPGNIMIGKYGETLVVDWGLAKPIGDTSAEKGGRPAGDGEEKTIQPSNTGSYEQTVQGTAIGTPAFMSPEQAEGRLDIIGKGSDIYSLGATLYVLVVGQLPFNGKTIEEFMGKVKRGEFNSPAEAKPGVSPALSAIVVRAMALKPADRYPSAVAMAEDIEHFLADEPVKAYAEPWIDKARRWARKHRSFVSAAVVTLLTSVIALGAGLFFVNAEKNRTILERNEKELARAAEQSQREKAELARNSALDALDAMTSNFTRESLITQQEITPEQKKFLEEAGAYYSGLMKEEASTQPMRVRRAKAAFRVGTIERRLGRNEEAEESFSRAAELFNDLSVEAPAQAEYRHEQGRALNNVGLACYLATNLQKATVFFSKASHVQEKLAGEFPNNPEYVRQWARTLTNLGNTWRAKGERDAAVGSLRQAIELQTKLVAASPKVPEYRNELAGSLSNLAIASLEQNQPAEADPLLRRALDIRVRLRQEFPDEAQYQEDLAKTHVNLAAAIKASGNPETAGSELRKAIELYEALTRLYPSMPQYQLNMAAAYYNLGDTLRRIKSAAPQEPVDAIRRAIEAQRLLALRYPKNGDYRSQLARSLNQLGNLSPDRKQTTAEAGKSYAESIALQEKLVEDSPANRDYRADLALSLNNQGAFLRAAGVAVDAEKSLRRASEIQRQLIADFPDQPVYAINQARTCLNLGDLLAAGKSEEAIKWYDTGVALASATLEKSPRDGRVIGLLKDLLAARQKWHEQKKDTGKAGEDAKRQAELDTTLRLSNARNFIQSGRVNDVIPALAELGKRPDLRPNQLLEFGRVYSLAAVKDAGNARKHSDEAILWLQKAAAAGVDVTTLGGEPEFAPLRGRDEFIKLVAGKK